MEWILLIAIHPQFNHQISIDTSHKLMLKTSRRIKILIIHLNEESLKSTRDLFEKTGDFFSF